MYFCDNCMCIWYMYSPIKLCHIMLTIHPPLEWYKYATLTSEVEGAKGLQCECDASDVCLGHSHRGRCGGDGGGGEPRSPQVAHLLVQQGHVRNPRVCSVFRKFKRMSNSRGYLW